MHDKSILARPVKVNLLLDDGKYMGWGLVLTFNEYYDFDKKYVGTIDVLCVTNRNKIEISRGVTHFSKKTSDNYWLHMDENS